MYRVLCQKNNLTYGPIIGGQVSILSGYRLENGIRFIQSDVNVLPGNSGGPLLDENGNVIGISVSALFLHNFPSGINFFIPINEAINSMNIRFQPLIL